MGVDESHQIITHTQSDLADQKDNQCLQDLTDNITKNLKRNGLEVENLLADAGYSSGENYAYLEQKGIKSYIPPHGTYKGGSEGFRFVEEGNYWLCPNEKKVTFRKKRLEKGTLKDFYLTKRSDCKDCPMKESCIGKSHERRISITAYKNEYERNNKHLKHYPYHKKKRMGLVEPVFGTLINFLGMRKVNTRGLKQANKCMLMAATAFNIKKLLKYGGKKLKTNMQVLENAAFSVFVATGEIYLRYKPLYFAKVNYKFQK